jgi:hypothetical protein
MSEGTSVVVRCAEVEDTDAVVTVLRRSITELCVADHRNDPGVLGVSLENKTAENVRTWIESPRNFMVVAEVGVPFVVWPHWASPAEFSSVTCSPRFNLPG